MLMVESYWRRTLQLSLPESLGQGPILPTSLSTNKPFVMLVSHSNSIPFKPLAATGIVMDRDVILICSLDIQGSIAATYRTVVDIK